MLAIEEAAMVVACLGAARGSGQDEAARTLRAVAEKTFGRLQPRQIT